ncbi:MAG: type II secretion system protein GspG [Verrucomicrobiae bacterium]|nr:type II secretion system protein GspG [Verrucomicrobiae bacterium]
MTGIKASIFGINELLCYVQWQTCRNRALADMLALSAAVGQFREMNGRLPSTDEYRNLHPVPGFQVPFETKSPETQTQFEGSQIRASGITDPFNRPYFYELGSGKFVIFSHSPDGVRSNDDFVYDSVDN